MLFLQLFNFFSCQTAELHNLFYWHIAGKHCFYYFYLLLCQEWVKRSQQFCFYLNKSAIVSWHCMSSE